MSFKYRHLTLLLAGSLLLALAGCNRPPKPPLVFGASAWPGYASIYLAHDLKYLPKQGIQLQEYASASEVAQAFRAHTLHLAAMTLTEALLLGREGKSLENGEQILFASQLAKDRGFLRKIADATASPEVHGKVGDFAAIQENLAGVRPGKTD